MLWEGSTRPRRTMTRAPWPESGSLVPGYPDRPSTRSSSGAIEHVAEESWRSCGVHAAPLDRFPYEQDELFVYIAQIVDQVTERSASYGSLGLQRLAVDRTAARTRTGAARVLLVTFLAVLGHAWLD